MLVEYDYAMNALSKALSSEDVSVVLRSRADLDQIKFRAKQIRDRELLSNATEFQMRVERWLGVLLIQAKQNGQLAEGRIAKGVTVPCNPGRITLSELGISLDLSSKSQHAARMKDEAFEDAIAEMRARIASRSAKVVTVITKAIRTSDRRRTSGTSSFDFLLESGKPIGALKIGSLRSHIARLEREIRIVRAIFERAQLQDNSTRTVEECVGQTTLQQIIQDAARAAA